VETSQSQEKNNTPVFKTLMTEVRTLSRNEIFISLLNHRFRIDNVSAQSRIPLVPLVFQKSFACLSRSANWYAI
jgi:hypothetical protein